MASDTTLMPAAEMAAPEPPEPEILTLRTQLVSAGHTKDLLAGTDIREEAWDEWLSGERRRIGNLACDMLEMLGRMELEGGRPGEALRLAEDCIRRDIFREDAHRLAIQSRQRVGDLRKER